MRLKEMKIVWDKLIKGVDPTTEDLKALHHALRIAKQERKLTEEEAETLEKMDKLGVEGQKIRSALCLIISYV